MGKEERERLNRTLTTHLSNIHETLQVLDHTPVSSLQKVSWDEVIKMGEQVSKQATTVGMLLTGEKPEVKALEESMQSYFNMLQGLLLLAYGSAVGAGPTLSSNIHASTRQIVDCSFMLWRESVSSYGIHNKVQKLKIPQLVGAVWDACSALKKTPSRNITAIGRAMTKVAVSMNDVLREMKELEPSSPDPTNESCEESSSRPETQPHDNDNSIIDDLGKDLSHEEMKIAQLTTGLVSGTVILVKELIRSITVPLKNEAFCENSEAVDTLEKLLKHCQSVGVEVDELGACLYPPQELAAITAASDKICSMTDEMQRELDSIKGSTEAFMKACEALRNSLNILKSEISM